MSFSPYPDFLPANAVWGEAGYPIAIDRAAIGTNSSHGDHMIRRSLSCDWTEEDRLTRAKWMRAMAIFYGCIALLVFAAIAVIKPSSIAPAGAADRQTRAAGSQVERVIAMPAR
jgi:hypothetical protein